MRKSFFTLLEVMIAVVLLALTAGVIGIRINRSLDEKQFQTAVDRLFLELESCRRQALNMQADWMAILEKRNGRFVLVQSCPETAKSAAHEWKAPCDLQWDHEKIERIAFLFSSTGKIAPAGLFEIIGTHKRIQWNVPQIFLITEGSDGALQRPDEKSVPQP